MNCKKCGSVLNENDLFCQNCGAAVNAQNESGSSEVSVSSSPVTPVTATSESVTPVAVSSESVAPVTPVVTSEAVTPVVPTPVTPTPVTAAPESVIPTTVAVPTESVTPVPPVTPVTPVTPVAPVGPVQNKNNNTVLYIVIGVLAVVAVFAIVVAFGNKGNSNSGTNPSSGTSTTVTGKTYSVTYDGFVFKIPNDLIYAIDDGLFIGDEDQTWASYNEVSSGSFSSLKSNMSKLSSAFEQSHVGGKASAAKLTSVAGVDFITMEATLDGDHGLYAYAKLNSTNIICLVILNEDNDFDYDALKALAPVYKDVEMAAKNNINSESKFEFNFTDELAQ